ncbi:hypothetical protein BGV47_16210 [Burkholderia ubonensis]|uniref:deoxynucleotide monophosphate kinase family protein n=1 Tax=Burkholderia ubonensis TaxID=101571 RepID=UPI0007534FC9|nr:hypothetical protein [Burkholderia ubonensis]KVD68710.1 hypothetical protein WI88_32650 [Burkholderia ubonensis]OJA37876.1 hypothetical protein BGV47_16210 [Burkholderia ubonensis]OJB29478.1 hypothetical protein BGV55_15360 [Burkholderia ubonensis]
MHKHSQDNLPLIGVTGRARSGKDTIGGYLTEHYGYHQVSFAEPLRQFVCNLIGIDRRALDFVKEDPVPWLGKSPRQMLQTLGTEWGRVLVNENIWVLVAMDEVARTRRFSAKSSVITDVRFDNEADAIRQRGGRIIHVARPDAVEVAVHASEAGVHKEHGDFTVINDGSLHDLYAKVDEIMETL